MTRGTPNSIHELVVQELTRGPLSTRRLRLEMAFFDYIRNRLNLAFMRAGDDQNKLNWLYEVGAILGTNEKVERTNLTEDELKHLDSLLRPKEEKVS